MTSSRPSRVYRRANIWRGGTVSGWDLTIDRSLVGLGAVHILYNARGVEKGYTVQVLLYCLIWELSHPPLRRLTANLINPARRLARGPRVQMQREKIREMGTSDEGDRTCTKRLGVYTLYNVVNKCIKNNQYYEHSCHTTLPITSTSERQTRRRSGGCDREGLCNTFLLVSVTQQQLIL